MVSIAASAAAAIMAATTGGAGPPPFAHMRHVRISVVAAPTVTRSFIEATLAEAEAIWRPAGVTLAWRRQPQADAVDAASPPELTVTVEDRSTNGRDGQTTLGWIHFAGRTPEAAIHLSRANAEALIEKASTLRDTPPVMHEALLARALGRALAHELGHYLLQSPAHVPNGLMRGVRPSADFFSPARNGFEMTLDECAWLAVHAPARGE
jgi:hypothetical protein